MKMTDDDLAMPYKIAPGTRVRLESLYEGDNRLLVRHAAYQSDSLLAFDFMRSAAEALETGQICGWLSREFETVTLCWCLC